MSRFESSRFVRNPQVMHVDVLKSACDALGWQYTIHDNILTVSDAKQKSRLYGEIIDGFGKAAGGRLGLNIIKTQFLNAEAAGPPPVS